MRIFEHISWVVLFCIAGSLWASDRNRECNFRGLKEKSSLVNEDWRLMISVLKASPEQEGEFLATIVTHSTRIAERMGGERDEQILADVANDVAVKIRKEVEDGKVIEDGNIRSWFTTIVLNNLRKERNKKNRITDPRSMQSLNPTNRKGEGYEIAVPSKELSPDDAITYKELSQKIEFGLSRAMDELTHDDKEVLKLGRQNLTIEEIAERLGVTVGIVRGRQSHARKIILKHLCNAFPSLEGQLTVNAELVNNLGGPMGKALDKPSLEDAIATLPRTIRTAFTGRLIEKKSFEQIAAEQDTSVRNVKDAYHRGTAELSIFLQRHDILDARSKGIYSRPTTLEEAIDSIPEHSANILRSLLIDGSTISETAVKLGIEPNKIALQVAAAEGFLRPILAAHHISDIRSYGLYRDPEQQVKTPTLEEAIATLSPSMRIALTGRLIEGATYGQIAARTGARADALEAAFNRGKKPLTEFLKKHDIRDPRSQTLYSRPTTLEEAIASVPGRPGALLRSLLIEGLTPRQAGEKLGWHISSMRERTTRVEKLLKPILEANKIYDFRSRHLVDNPETPMRPRHLAEAIAYLPPQQQKLAASYYLLEKTIPQIAKETGVAETTLGSQRGEIDTLLRSLLEGSDINDPRSVSLYFNPKNLTQAIYGLTPAQQEVVNLMLLDGMSKAEIAEEFELTLAVVEDRVFRGRRRLREILAKYNIPAPVSSEFWGGRGIPQAVSTP